MILLKMHIMKNCLKHRQLLQYLDFLYIYEINMVNTQHIL